MASHGTIQFYDYNSIRQGNANGNHTSVYPNCNLASRGEFPGFGGIDQIRPDWVSTPATAYPLAVTWTISAATSFLSIQLLHIIEYF